MKRRNYEGVDPVRCEVCGKPKGYKGHLGAECMCQAPKGSALKGAPSVGTQATKSRP